MSFFPPQVGCVTCICRAMPSKYNALAAQLRIVQRQLQRMEAAPQWPQVVDIQHQQFLQLQSASYATHRRHNDITGYDFHFPTTAAFYARPSISQSAYRGARALH